MFDIKYLQELRRRGNIDFITCSVNEDSITFYMYKGDFELHHSYSLEVIEDLYCPSYAIKSELEQMAIDLLKAWRTENGNDTTEETTCH